MRELNTFKKILEENEECFSLLTLKGFFEGNTQEDSIAPNQWDYFKNRQNRLPNLNVP